MAYAALVSLEHTIDQILNNDRYSTSPQEKRLIISLDKYVISLQAFLEDFPEKGNNLEGRIRDVATAAEDIIEYIMLDQIPSCCGYMWDDEQTRIKFGHELNKEARKMESLVADTVEIKNNIIIKHEQLNDSFIAKSSSVMGKIDMVGFDDDLMEIKTRLIGGSLKLQFLSIIGMGGIGKTTLAKTVYDDLLIQEHFQIRAWVTVSQDYSTGKILSSLLDSVKEFNPKGTQHRDESESIEEMAVRVHKILTGRRYLIVMDDMWSTKVLDDVRKLFPNDDNGSRIMLTTRLSDVASYADSSIPPYEMRLMDDDQSWYLFQQKVFAHQNSAPPELEIIGKEIARSCRGLPLAVVVIAGVLSTTSKTPASWGIIAKNINSAASKDEQVEKILSLSYNHLPHHLRPCLLYMGVFPEDYRIRVSELIKLWIAEGFLKHPNESKSLEEGAEQYLEDLVGRNLILVTERKTNGRIKSCSLHDMVRNTCIKLLEKEKYLRHVMKKVLKNTKNPLYLNARSILRFDDIQGPFEHFRLLRILQVPNHVDAFESAHPNIEHLYHLRYLATTSYRIPSAISNLQNLQTLVIDAYDEVKLPSSIWKMLKLRHLIFIGSLPDPRGATSALENLQTLKQVYNLERVVSVHKMIPNLRELGVYCYSDEYYLKGGLNMDLLKFHQLEKFKITDGHVIRGSINARFPESLKKCSLRKWEFSLNLLEALGSLPNLEVLKLRSCLLSLRNWRIGGGEFPQLRFLLIDSVEFDTLVTEDSSVLPRLKWLRLHNCHQLKEISDDIGEIPTLEMIEVKNCGVAVHDWAERIEEEQESLGNDTLQVHCIRPIQLPMKIDVELDCRFLKLEMQRVARITSKFGESIQRLNW